MEMSLAEAFGEIDPGKHLRAAEVDHLHGDLIPARRQRQRTFDDIIAMNDGTKKRMEQIGFLVALGASDQVSAELVFERKNIRKTDYFE